MRLPHWTVPWEEGGPLPLPSLSTFFTFPAETRKGVCGGRGGGQRDGYFGPVGSAQPRRALESDPGPAALSRDLSRAASRRRVSRAPGRCIDRVRVRCIDRDRGDRFFLRRPRRQPRPARREMNCVVTEEQAGRSEWRLLADPNGAPADCRPEGSVPTHAPSRSATGAADGNHGRRSEPHQPRAVQGLVGAAGGSGVALPAAGARRRRPAQ